MNSLANLFGDAALICADVGARGGMQRHWQPYANYIVLDAFEPDAAACEAQRAAKRPNENWFPVGLGRQSGPAKLFVLKKASSSSLFPPNYSEIEKYEFGSNSDLQAAVEIPLLSFSDFIDQYDRQPPHLIKLDTQGAELDILKGLRDEHWRDLIAIQTEAEFVEFYSGQPLFHELDAHIRSKGFVLFDLLPQRVYRTNGSERHHFLKKYLGIARNRHDISCRMVACDALYFRPPEEVLKSGDRRMIARMFLTFMIYRCLDEALWFAERAHAMGIIEQADFNGLVEIVRRAAPKPRPWQAATKAGKRWRRLLKNLGISTKRKIEYWMDRSWDY